MANACMHDIDSKLTFAAVFSNITVTGFSKTVLPSPTTDKEKTLLAKYTFLSLPRNTAVCEIKELLKRTLPPREEKNEAGRSASSALFCKKSMV